MPSNQPKPLVWLCDTLDTVRSFPENARKEVGHQLGQVQEGGNPVDWKPMESAGAGVREVRIRVETAYRVVYVAKFPEAVYVLHAFQKKSQKTPRADIELANRRYRELVSERKPK